MTDDGESGAACAMPGVEHAVDVARAVKEETPHVLVAGDRAVALAEAFDVATDCDLWTEATRERWREADPPVDASTREQLAWVREQFGGEGDRTPGSASEQEGDPRNHDTVGAVATDGEHLAAATSTGGRWFALAGRVGDVPGWPAGSQKPPAPARTHSTPSTACFGGSPQKRAARLVLSSSTARDGWARRTTPRRCRRARAVGGLSEHRVAPTLTGCLPYVQ
jgi:isoaspartyl peptidase/L-asparaginase-like protein (Ntn-hydrolase superfamily)